MSDAFERHRDSVARVLPRGDADSIKRLYVELGRDLWSAYGGGDGELDEVPVLSAPETAAVVVAAVPRDARVILDAGCGPNPAVALTLGARRSASVVALDIGEGTVRLARRLAAHRGVALVGVVGDVERLPFRTAAFDAVVCDDTVEHLPEDRTGVAELGRVLRRRGRLVLATPNRRSIEVLYRRAVDVLRRRRRSPEAYYAATSHLREYTWREAEALLVERFHRLRRRPVGWGSGRRFRVVTPLLRVPGLYRLSQMVVLEAERR